MSALARIFARWAQALGLRPQGADFAEILTRRLRAAEPPSLSATVLEELLLSRHRNPARIGRIEADSLASRR